MRFFNSAESGSSCAMEAICSFPFVGILQLQQQFLSGPKAGRGLERREEVLLSHIFLARREIRAGKIEWRGSLVERLQSDHRAVFADRPLGIVLREPQIAEMPVKVFVNRINVIEAVESGRRVRWFAEFLFERSKLLQRLWTAPAHFFVVGQNGGGGLFVSFRQVGLSH